MNRLALTSLITAGLALAACNNNEPEVVGGPTDPQAEELANAAPVKLPPAMVASHSYRCSGDNSVIYIDWYDDGSARVKKDRNSVGDKMTAAEGSSTLTGEGLPSLTGSADAGSVTYGGKSCKR